MENFNSFPTSNSQLPTYESQPLAAMSITTTTTATSKPKRMSFPDGDVVIKSVDGVKFCLHSIFLCRASPYFQDALAENPPTLVITETAETFNTLLQYIYPTPQKSSIHSIERCTNLLAAAVKLKIEVAVPSILTHLRKLLEDVPNPVRAWAIAVQCRYPAGQRDSIRRLLTLDDPHAAQYLIDEIDELKHTTGLHYRKLINWRKHAVENARTTIHRVFEPCGTVEDETSSGCAGKLPTSYEERHTALLAGGSPFSDLASSDFMFKMAAATSGCAECAKKEANDGWMGKVGQLRAELTAQMNDALGKLKQIVLLA